MLPTETPEINTTSIVGFSVEDTSGLGILVSWPMYESSLYGGIVVAGSSGVGVVVVVVVGVGVVVVVVVGTMGSPYSSHGSPPVQIQLARLGDGYELPGHCEHSPAPVSGLYVPSMHCVHGAAPVATFCVPVSQAVQLAPSAPTLHLQLALFSGEYESPWHGEHSVLPSVDVYVFGGHQSHQLSDHPGLYFPGLHGMQLISIIPPPMSVDPRPSPAAHHPASVTLYNRNSTVARVTARITDTVRCHAF